jgi:hypothetical protein
MNSLEYQVEFAIHPQGSYCYCYWGVTFSEGIFSGRAGVRAPEHQSAITHTDICSRNTGDSGPRGLRLG